MRCYLKGHLLVAFKESESKWISVGHLKLKVTLCIVDTDKCKSKNVRPEM